MKVKFITTVRCSGVTYKTGNVYDLPNSIVKELDKFIDIIRIDTEKKPVRKTRSKKTTK